MQYRPIPIIVIAILHILEPIIKVIYYSILFQVTPWRMIALEFASGEALHLFEFFLLFPLAGLAILALKKWSLYAFLIIEAWVMVANFPLLMAMLHSGEIFQFSLFVWFAIVNIGYVVYFLVPAVRIAYLDPKIRWWEAHPRYKVDFTCEGEAIAGKVLNISKSGIFLHTQNALEQGRDYSFQLQIENREISLQAKCIHSFAIDGQQGFGMQFVSLGKEQKIQMKSLIRHLEVSGVSRRPARRNLKKEIQDWFKTLVKTGKGLFPKSS